MKELVRDLAVSRVIDAYFTGGAVQWSANGKIIFSTCTNVVKAINLDDDLYCYIVGDEEETLRITTLCVDDLRNRLVIAYNNNIIKEYILPNTKEEAPTVARMWKTMHTAPITNMKFNVDYTVLATGSSDNNVKVWNMVQKSCTHTLKGKTVVSALNFVRGDRLAAGYIDGTVNLFDLIPGAPEKLLHSWKSHTSQITAICDIPDSRLLVVTSRDQTLSILESETRQVVKVLPLFESIESAAIACNGNLITVGEKGELNEWKIDTARLLRRKKLTGGRLDIVLFNSVRNQVLGVSAEGNIFVVDFDKFKSIRQIVGFQDEVYCCCILGERESHLAVASNTNVIRLYDLNTWDCSLVEGHKESVLSIANAHWDKSIVASCSKDNTIILWKFDGTISFDIGSLLVPQYRITGHTSSVNNLMFSHSQKRPFLVSVSTDTTLKLWSLVEVDLLSKKVHASLDDLPHIACSSTIVAHAKEAGCVDVSLSDSLCVTGGLDKLAKLWHIDSTRMQFGIAGTLTGHRRGVAGAKFSPNSQKVATCSGDMRIRIWSIQDKSCLQTLEGHSSAVYNIVYINHGSQLISGDSAGVIKIWNLATNESENSIDAHSDKIWTLTCTSDESKYISSGTDGRIVIWKDVSEERIIEEDNKRRQRIEEEQTLSNLLEQERYGDALDYALGLIRPHCAYKVIDQLIDRGLLQSALGSLENSKTQVLLDFIVQWNTNSRTSNVGQQTFCVLLAIHSPDDLLKFSNISSFVQGMIPYTRRHVDRLNKSRQDAALLKFTWDQMRLN